MARTLSTVAERGVRRKPLPPDTLERLLAIRRGDIVDAGRPLVLIAQPTRSGGTLLSQLFDSHPAVHSHPPELRIGNPGWPSLDLRDPPEVWFKSLRERHLVRGFRDGYRKNLPARRLGLDGQLEQFPIMLPPAFQRELFLDLVQGTSIETQRDVLDVYFTALFNAWLDNQNLYRGPKRWTVAFRGRMHRPKNLAGFFGDYPDGRHITCVRDPKGRIASKLVFSGERELIGDYADGWRVATEHQLEAKERYGESVFLLTFEQLVTETERTMRALSGWLGIGFDPVLTEPTFNGFPIKANSSFAVGRHGVLREPLDKWREVLSDEEAENIDVRSGDVYDRARALATEART